MYSKKSDGKKDKKKRNNILIRYVIIQNEFFREGHDPRAPDPLPLLLAALLSLRSYTHMALNILNGPNLLIYKK